MTREELLRGEAYVVWLLKTAPVASLRLREYRCIGPSTQLKNLKKKGTLSLLAGELKRPKKDVSEKDVFGSLKEEIESRLQSIPPFFNGGHLRFFKPAPDGKHPLLQSLGSKLGLGTNTSLDEIFDRSQLDLLLGQLQATGQVIKKNIWKCWDTDQFLVYIITQQRDIENSLSMRDESWGLLLSEKSLLTADAEKALKEWATDQGYRIKTLEEKAIVHYGIDEADKEQGLGSKLAMTMALAGAIDEVQGGKPAGSGGTLGFKFDTIAVRYLRHRLLDAAGQLRDNAIAFAVEAAQRTPQFTPIRVLPAQLQYECGAIAGAVSYLLEEERVPLRAFIPSEAQVVPYPSEGAPDDMRPLRVELSPAVTSTRPKRARIMDLVHTFLPNTARRAENESTLPKPKTVFLDVYGSCNGKEVQILRIGGLSDDTADALKKEIEALEGSVLAKKTGTLSERLLSVRVPIRNENRRLFREALKELLPELVQCMVLCRTEMPFVKEALWDGEVSPGENTPNATNETGPKKTAQKMPFIVSLPGQTSLDVGSGAAPTQEDDTQFPKTIQDIVNDIKDRYQDREIVWYEA